MLSEHDAGDDGEGEGESPFETFWDLPMETMLEAKFREPPVAGEEAILILVLDNLYGPLDDIGLYVRLGDPEAPTPLRGFDSVADWMIPLKRSETLFLDDGNLPRGSISEPLTEEIPWAAVFELPLQLKSGINSIEIALRCDAYKRLDGVLDPWPVEPT